MKMGPGLSDFMEQKTSPHVIMEMEIWGVGSTVCNRGLP